MDSNLVFCSGIARGRTVLAHFSPDDLPLDFSSMASQCLPHVPPLHTRFSFTACDRMFLCILDSGLTYFAIVDEALPKSDALQLLHDVRREFRRYLRSRGEDPKSLPQGWAQKHMKKKMELMAKPLTGMPQKQRRAMEEEERERQQKKNGASTDSAAAASSSSSTTLPDIGPSSLERWGGGGDGYVNIPIIQSKPNHESSDQGTDEDHHGTKSSVSPQNSISKYSDKEWRRGFWKIFALDVVICVILLVIWLGVCGGTACLSSQN